MVQIDGTGKGLVVVGAPGESNTITISREGTAFLITDATGIGAGAGCSGGPETDSPAAPATIFGGPGEDVLVGNALGDILYGGPERDILRGAAGRDLFRARDGERDRIYGGPGRDRARIDREDITRDRGPDGGAPLAG